MNRIPARIIFFTAIFLLVLSAACYSQSFVPPAKFFELKTPESKAVFLCKMMKDSLKASAYTHIAAIGQTTLNYIKEAKADTLLPKTYQYIGESFENTGHTDSAAFYFRLSYFSNPFPLKRLYPLQALLYISIESTIKDSILFYIHETETTLPLMPETGNKLTLTNSLADAYTSLNRYDQTIRCLRMVTQQAGKIKDTQSMRNAIVNVGSAYSEMTDYRMAVNYTLQALPYLGKESSDKIAVYNNLAQYYQMLHVTDSAKMYLLPAYAFALESKDEDAVNAVAVTKASLLISEKNYPLAEALLEKSLRHFEQQKPGVFIVNSLLVYAGLDTLQNNYPKAQLHLEKLYSIMKAEPAAYRAETVRMLAAVNQRLGNYKDAFKYQEELQQITDSVKSEKNGKAFAELQAEYQALKKQEQINALQKTALIRDLELKTARINKIIFIVLLVLVVSAFLIIIYNRNLRNRATLQTVKATLETKALRSQMNPHFIFNSLNSIQKYIWENRKEDASEYLTKFARLIRLVLENSGHAAVTLSEELDALRLYIEMEHRRNNQKFDYSITLDDNVDPAAVIVPPLLLQPYVENAIWHGLSEKEGGGKLSVNIQRTADSLICSIDDTGIGRVKSAENKVNKVKRTSLGMNISAQRIEWLQKTSGKAAGAVITDKYDGTTSAGTAVMITLPLIKND